MSAGWAVVREHLRFILLGAYPFDQQWRPALAVLLFLALYGVSARRACWRPWLGAVWIAAIAAAVALMRGGFAGLPLVRTDAWGGLPLTLLLATAGFAAAFPPAVALALGRRSSLPAVRALCTAYVELARGVPLITFLFMASLMFPLFVPPGFAVDKLLRAQVALALVMAASLAEVVRGGLEAVPAGQREAAASLGLGFWPATVMVVLPQALRVSIPALVNTFIAFFKDTSLVIVIGLFDLLGTARAVVADPRTFGAAPTVYLLVGSVYFSFCWAVSRYSRHLERALAGRGAP